MNVPGFTAESSLALSRRAYAQGGSSGGRAADGASVVLAAPCCQACEYYCDLYPNSPWCRKCLGFCTPCHYDTRA
jgi:hypothetical protein